MPILFHHTSYHKVFIVLTCSQNRKCSVKYLSKSWPEVGIACHLVKGIMATSGANFPTQTSIAFVILRGHPNPNTTPILFHHTFDHKVFIVSTCSHNLECSVKYHSKSWPEVGAACHLVKAFWQQVGPIFPRKQVSHSSFSVTTLIQRRLYFTTHMIAKPSLFQHVHTAENAT